LLFNYSIPLVPPNPTLRRHLEGYNTPRLWQELMENDPGVKTFIEPHHRRRIIRALEVVQATGKPFSTQRQAHAPRYSYEVRGIFPGWDVLEKYIRQRAEAMITQGLIEEARRLRYLHGPHLPLLRTINYREALAYLGDDLTRDDLADAIIRANLRYARRQMSWWKRNERIMWLCA
ncbi:MAG: tRNA (adenosine(37)-N6)-dimethylallyltransferase MiaA, partial [Acidobacteriota bacterium]